MAFVHEKKFANIFTKKLEMWEFLVLNLFSVSQGAKNQASKLKSFLKFANLLSRFCSRVVLPTFENGFYKKRQKNLQKKFANRFRYKNPPFGRFHFYHKAQKILVHSFHKCDKIEGYRVFHLLTLLVFGLVF